MASPILVNKMTVKMNCQQELELCGPDEDTIRGMLRSYLSSSIQTAVKEVKLDKLTRISLTFPALVKEETLVNEEQLLERKEYMDEVLKEDIVMASNIMLNENNNIAKALYNWKTKLVICTLKGGKINNNYRMKRLEGRGRRDVKSVI